MTEKKIPELRFKGFSDEWEQRKLGEISDKVKEKNKSGKITETLTNSAEYGIITQRDFFDKDISNAKNLDGYYVVKNDDFVYNPRISNFAPVGPIKRNKLGRTGIMSPLYYIFRTHDVSKNYMEKYFDTVYWHRFMELNGDSGARADRFAIKDSVFIEMPIPYPLIVEQEKIGNFFDQLDNTIALHQRKLDLLKQLKKAYLQKLFPKNDEIAPEFRFTDFEDEWEQRKLSELAKFNPKSSLPNEFEYVDLESVVGTELVGHRTETKLSAPSRAQRLARKNDVFYQTVRPYQKNNYLFNLPYNNYVFSTGYAQMRPRNSGYFLLALLQEDKFVNRVLVRSTGTSYPAINSNDLAKISIKVPSDKKEQKEIGIFFKQLDNTISLHQNKLNQLKQLKLALLQKMFI